MTNSVGISPTEVVGRYRVLAVVGASKNAEKDAHTVPLYLKEKGYRIIPVNPTASEIFGEKAYSSLGDIPAELAKQVEVVVVFRPSEELQDVARQAAAMRSRYGRPLAFWAQLGIESQDAKRILDAAGLPYVMNACMRVVHSTTHRS